jgi:hypothetical protein
LEEIIFKIFNISENNRISVELAKVQGYFPQVYVWYFLGENVLPHSPQALIMANPPL